MSRYAYSGLLLVFIFIVGAGMAYFYKKADAPAVPPVPQEQAGEFGGVSLMLDYATTTRDRELGLGGRDSIPENFGMLFVFPTDDTYGFWMQDMLVPIDIYWLDAQGQVVSIKPDVAPETYPNVFYPSSPARYVLETAAGFAAVHGIVVGTSLDLKNFPSVTE